MNRLPRNKAGVIIIFDEQAKTAKVIADENIILAARQEFWKKNFWHFSWFITSPAEYRHDLAERLMKKDYDELWDFS